MSFRIFKTHAPKKSAISRTAEREFEREAKKCEGLDENAKKLNKEMKWCSDSQAAMVRCEMKMTQDLLNSALCKEDDKLRNIVENWNHSTTRIDMLMQEMTAISNKAVMEPMKKFGTIFPSLLAAIKKREQSLQEYNKCLAKMEKYQDKERTGANIVKLDSSRRSLAVAKEDYDSQNSALMEDMPRLYDGRIDYFTSSFQTLIQAQVRYYTESQKVYAELSRNMNGEKDESTEQSRQRVQQKLSEIRALSITVDG